MAFACFNLLFRRRRRRPRPGRDAGPTPATSAPNSNTGLSRSDDSGAGQQTSKSSGSTSSQQSIPAMFEERAHGLRVFGLPELRAATNDFHRMLKIGEGGFGSVYKAFVRPADGKGDKITVAVKRLNQKGLQKASHGGKFGTKKTENWGRDWVEFLLKTTTRDSIALLPL